MPQSPIAYVGPSGTGHPSGGKARVSQFREPAGASRAMIETRGPAREGCTFPVIEQRSQPRSAVQRRPGRNNPMLTVVPDGCPGHEGGKDDAARSLVRAGAVVRDSVPTGRPEPAAA
jgi:hypothetical protein